MNSLPHAGRFFLALGLATLVLGGSVLPAHSLTANEEMAEAANHFLNALSPEHKAAAHFDWKDEERFNWHFIPKDRKGLAVKDMTVAERQLAEALLASGLSQRGHVKALTIMSLEQVLQDMEGPNRRFPRDPALYYFSIFGTPGPKATWGWRVEGHHLALNFTVVKGEFISGTPSFLGSNPAEIQSGPRKGLRALAAEEDIGRQLVKSLNATQLKAAVITDKAPADVITGAARKVSPLDQVGLPASEMSPEQIVVLKKLIEEYVRRNRADVADIDLKKIHEHGFSKIYFAWAGGTDKGQGHYYRVQGPTFLLEYDCTQNDANHIHAVWRDFNGDFGEDLLKKHYDATPHP